MTYRQQQETLIRGLEEQLNNKQSTGSTIVSMRNNYEDDNEICLTSVVFLPKELQQTITSELIEPLKAIQPAHHFYPGESLHLTIKNIRTIHQPPLFTEENQVAVDQLFTKLIPQQKSFSFDLNGLVKFPTSLSIAGYSDERLLHLVQALDCGLNEIGVPDNKTYISDTVFFGNVTFCRFTEPPTDAFLAEFNKRKNTLIGELSVNTISLISCNAVCSKKTLTIINTYQLA